MKVVAISGPTCSGKTTIAQNLLRLIPGSILVSQDDFYLPDSEMPETDGVANWDCPESFDMDKFASVVKDLREGKVTEYHKYEKPTNVIEGEFSVPSEPIAIVEGIMLYQKDSQVRPLFDQSFLIDGEREVLKQRRDGRKYDTMEGTWEDPPGYFDHIVWPEYQKNYGYLLSNPLGNSPNRPPGIIVVPPAALDMSLKFILDLLC